MYIPSGLHIDNFWFFCVHSTTDVVLHLSFLSAFLLDYHHGDYMYSDYMYSVYQPFYIINFNSIVK